MSATAPDASGARRGMALVALHAGQAIPYGGDREARVSADLAGAFRPGDRLVVVHETGDLLHIPAAQAELADAAVTRAIDGFHALASCTDEQIGAFYDAAASLLDDDERWSTILAANSSDVAAARGRGRAVGRLELTPKMRADMAAGLRMWRDEPPARDAELCRIDHDGWSVSTRRAPLGVVGFVFEGRPNVFADACGVLRSGNTAVLRIGSDALGTARAIVAGVIEPALARSGVPTGCVVLLDAAAHAAGWALFADRRLGLAVARGSGAAVAQLGAVARQHGVPASLHGTGGAWMIVAPDADPARLGLAVRHSLDRKVCNTLNVCCLTSADSAEQFHVVREAIAAAGAARGVRPVVHLLEPDDPRLATEWEWDDVPEVAVVVVDDVAAAVEQCNRYSPHFVASLISDDRSLHQWFYDAVDAPFVGDGFTRWVDGQFALSRPELGLSNWQGGRLFARGGVLSGDSVYTVRLLATVTDAHLHR